MTDVAERVIEVEPHLDKDGNPCATATHNTSWSYRLGCRHPFAEKRKRETTPSGNDRRKRAGLSPAEQRRSKVIVNPDPQCPADRHAATIRGWREGCRCRGAVAARERELQQQRDYKRCAAGEVRDPRARWQHESMRCDRMNLWLLLHGIPQVDRATGQNVNTATERLAAILRWDGRLRHPHGELYTREEIGHRLGITASMVGHLAVEEVVRRRARRTARRMAEAQWRAMRNERLTGSVTGRWPRRRALP